MRSIVSLYNKAVGLQPTAGWITLLAVSAVLLQVLLAWNSPYPDGYVHDFYSDAVEHFYLTGVIPTAKDCWTCYHPPLLPVLGGTVFSIADSLGATRNVRYTVLATLLGILSLYFVYYSCRVYLQYRKDNGRWFDLLAFSLVCFLPVRVISSHAIENEILVATLIVIAIFYSGEYLKNRTVRHLLIAGVFAGLAALTKYTGALIAMVLIAVLAVDWIISRHKGGWRHVACFSALIALIGLGPYIYNQFHYGTPFPGNASWIKGDHASKYSFTKFSINRIVETFNREDDRMLGHFKAYSNEYITSHHGQLWTDHSFFTVPARHGQAHRNNLHSKDIPLPLIEAILTAGIPTILLSVIGGIFLFLRPKAYVLLSVAGVSLAVYIFWSFQAPIWMLKTKYFLYLTPLLPIALSVIFARGYPLVAKSLIITPSIALSIVYSFYFATA